MKRGKKKVQNSALTFLKRKEMVYVYKGGIF